jgi:hypothetical protein
MHTHIHVHRRARVSLPPSARPWNMLGRMHVHVHPTIEESELLTPRVTRCIFIPGNDRPSPRARARARRLLAPMDPFLTSRRVRVRGREGSSWIKFGPDDGAWIDLISSVSAIISSVDSIAQNLSEVSQAVRQLMSSDHADIIMIGD